MFHLRRDISRGLTTVYQTDAPLLGRPHSHHSLRIRLVCEILHPVRPPRPVSSEARMSATSIDLLPHRTGVKEVEIDRATLDEGRVVCIPDEL